MFKTEKCWLERDLNSHRFAVLLVELSSPQGLEASFIIQLNCTRYSFHNLTLIHERMCSLSILFSETGRRLSGWFAEHLRSVRNKDLDEPVSCHFNSTNLLLSDITACAISPIYGGNDSRKRQEKPFIFKPGTINPNWLNKPLSFV